MDSGAERKDDFISTHDTEKLQEYFNAHFPNPEEEFGWKLTMLVDRLIDSKKFLVSFSGIILGFAVLIPYSIIEDKLRRRKHARKKNLHGKQG